MKYFISIVINIIVVAFCLYILNIYDIHLMNAGYLNEKNLLTSVNYLKSNNIKSKIPFVDLDVGNASVLPALEHHEENLSLVVTPVLETVSGAMSAYGPDCAGCSGHLGGGFDASGGNYIYTDATYGNIRIVAGDSKYPYGTIVKVSNSKIGEFNAIVLDRGGDIGVGRRFTFDLLFPTEAEAASFGTNYDCTFDILRYGY